MDKLKWLDKYSGQTTEELVALEGKYRTDSIVLAFEDALSHKLAEKGKIALSTEELVVLSIESLEREVNNDGFDGFFRNDSKEFVSIVVNSLNQINCGQVAELTSRAIKSLSIEGEYTRETIDNAMNMEYEERTKILNECSNEYFKIAGDLAKPLLNFIKTTSGKIILK
jgi:hypothetical protein